MVFWIQKVWCSRPEGLRKEKNILVWDSFRAHLTDEVKNELKNANTNVDVIPGGLTSLLQPLDVCINKPFNDKFRKKYTDSMAFGEHSFTPAGKMRKPSGQNILNWINETWNEVESNTVEKSLKKCDISSSMDGTEDDDSWNTSDSKNEIPNENNTSTSESENLSGNE